MASSASADDVPAVPPSLPSLLCPSCDVPFGTVPEDSMPITFACGHSLCDACVSAVNNTLHPKCVICQEATNGRAVVNRGLAALCDLANGVVSESVASSSVSEAVKKRKREPKAQSGENLSVISKKAKSVDEIAAEVSQKTALLQESSSLGEDALHTLTGIQAGMIQRKEASLEALRASVVAFKQALDAKVAEIEAELNTVCKSRLKALEAQANSYFVGIGQQRAAIVCGERALASRSRDQLDAAHATLTLCQGAVKPWCGPAVPTFIGAKWMSNVSQTAFNNLIALQDSKTFPKCKITGPGLSDYVVGSNGDKNRLTIKFLSAASELVTVPVFPADVIVRFSQLPSAEADFIPWQVLAIEPREPGVYHVTFTVPPESSNGAVVSVSICGTSVATAECCGLARARGVFRRAVHLTTGEKSGVAVNGDGTLMAVSHNAGRSCVRFYALPSGDEVASTVPLAATRLRKLCFVPPAYETILVCSYLSREILEYKIDGTLVRRAGMVDGGPRRDNTGPTAIACDGHRVVTAGCNEFMVFDYETMAGSVADVDGERWRQGFGDYGLCTGMRFAGPNTIVCSHSKRLSAYVTKWALEDSRDPGSVPTLKHVKHTDLTEFTPRLALSDIEVLPTGECAVSCKESNSVIVLDPDFEGNRCWGDAGSSEGKLASPSALALHGSLLYVLDSDNNRVQLFH